jgi:prepilin-type N-terminal cleavage/methylation domain-containing protein
MRRKGFTIIEILVAITIIALASTWAAVVIYRGIGSTTLKSTALTLQRTAQYGQLIAGQKHQPCQLQINIHEKTYRLNIIKRGYAVNKKNEEPQTFEGVLESEDIYSQIKKLPENIHFGLVITEDQQTEHNGEVSISFHVDGSAQAALIQLRCEDDAQTILINPVTAKAELYNKAIEALPSEKFDLDKPAGNRAAFK